MRTADVIVAGGGPAGSAAAARLADAGVRVILVERTSGAHHKVCGEFVGADGWRLLDELGLDSARSGAAPIERVRLVRGERMVQSPLPFPAMGLSRRTLDERLLDAARTRGAEVMRGRSVRTVAVAPAGVTVALSDGTALAAGALFLATGKHELRGYARPRGIRNRFIGLKMHLDLTPAAARCLARTVSLLMFDGGYAGLQPIGRAKANLCLLVTDALYKALDRSWLRLMETLAGESPVWREWLAGARSCWERPLAIYGLPYGHVGRPEGGPIFRLGDQMAVVPSFAGDGIAMALWSARRAAETFLANGPDAGSYHTCAARRFGPGVRAAAWASRAIERQPAQALAISAAAASPRILAWIASATRLAA